MNGALVCPFLVNCAISCDALSLAENRIGEEFDNISSVINNHSEKMFKYAAMTQTDTMQAEIDIHNTGSDLYIEFIMHDRYRIKQQ